MAQFAAQAIVNKARMSSAQVFFQPEDSVRWHNMGNVTGLEFTPNVQEVEDWSRQNGVKTLIGTYLVQKDGTLALKTKSFTEFVYAMQMMSDPSYLTRTAQADADPLEFDKPAVGDLYAIWANADILSSDDGAAEDAIEWVEDTHFTYHRDSGMTEVLAIPEGAEKLVIKQDVAAIAATEKRLSLDLLSNEGVRGKLKAVGVNQVGAKGELNLGSVQFRPDGAVAIVGGDDLDEASVTGRVYAVNGKYGTWTSYAPV